MTLDRSPATADPAGRHRRSRAADVLEAKLSPPLGRRPAVRRAPIRRLLEDAPDAGIISVVAPAGFGKASLASLLAADIPTAWLTADPGDDEPIELLRYLAVAAGRVGTLEPDVFDLLARREVSARAVLARILRALNTGEPVQLVVDDVDRIQSPESLDVIAELVDNMPQACSVILLGRDLAELPFARSGVAVGGG